MIGNALLVITYTMMLASSSHAQSATTAVDANGLVGAWRLVAIEEPGRDGKLTRRDDLKGTLIYTASGQMSVQVMYPTSVNTPTTEYVQGGYEASFGTYDVNPATHTVTHHVVGSLTRSLVGKDLPRIYQVIGGRLLIHSARPDEHWSVTWEHLVP